MASLEEQLVAALLEQGRTLAVAESMTGGGLGERITRVPGAGDAFLGGFITYTDRMKAELLGVDAGRLRREGAVTSWCAAQMAEGARKRTGADMALSVTGLAGPDAPDGMPVGLVHLGLALPDGTQTRRVQLDGDRADVRRQTLDLALRLALDALGPR